MNLLKNIADAIEAFLKVFNGPLGRVLDKVPAVMHYDKPGQCWNGYHKGYETLNHH